jgi:hypothetical protein
VCPTARAPRLYANEGRRLYVADLPGGYRRSSLFYVYGAAPLPHASTPPRIAILQGTNRYGTVLEAAWYCPPTEDVAAILEKDGLLVEEVAQDAFARVGRCFGHYDPGTEAEWKPGQAFVDLRLDLGKMDGVSEGNRFEVLGKPIVESVNRVVTGFNQIGECVVEPYKVLDSGATCRLDRQAWGTFTREDLVRGGLVRLKAADDAARASH